MVRRWLKIKLLKAKSQSDTLSNSFVTVNTKNLDVPKL